MAELPDRAEVVIVGGGIVGCSIAYHLAKRGVTDVLLLEQGQLTGGTTWHAAGLVSQLKSSHSLTSIATYSTRLFEQLEAETGQATGYRVTGSISVADNPERWEEILRGLSMAKTVGVEAYEISPAEALDHWPTLNMDDVVGAVYIPRDAQTSPVDTTLALAKGAKNRGVRIVEGVAVTSLHIENDRIGGVFTEQGYIEADTVVLAAGVWTRHLAQTGGINVPLQACEHFYIVTQPIDGVKNGAPTVRDPGNYTYFKEEAGKIMAGFFEPRGKVWRMDQIPRDFSFGTLPEDWDHVGPIFERAIHRMPALGEAGLQLFFNGPEAFTPDGVYYLGETPEVDGVFVAAGFNSVGIQSAGGVGWVLADWIIDGEAPMDLSAVDIRRAFPYQADERFLKDRISESLGLLYAMHWPFRQYESARGIMKSPFHDRLDAAGAVWGETAGWERPNWYARPGQQRVYEYSYGKQNWFDNCAAECRAVRETVGLFDQTSFAKFTVDGPDALDVLNQLSANDIDVPVGKVVYTQWLNTGGGIEADLTVVRIGDESFKVVTAAAGRTREWARLRRQCVGRDVEIAQLAEPMLGLMGPNARALLSSISTADFSNGAFPFGTAQHVVVGGVGVHAMRLSYVGAIGWELYVSEADAIALYDTIVAAGVDHGLVHAGYHAMNSLRLESGYRHWGHDISDEDTPLEAGLGFAVAWDKPGGFIGKAALLKQKGQPLRKRLIQLKLEDPDTLLYHDEPIYRDGELVGRTSSGMWSYTLGSALAMGYVTNPEGITKDWVDSGSFEIEVAGRRIPAIAGLGSWYKPQLHG
ncbi:MAG: FAD-dependent oxidoreductase [Acidimicrobiia bacterium]|nr:FAD-dependent oxidoreductase [Acidimicrobiia bacterium]